MKNHKNHILALVVFLAVLFNLERLDVGSQNTINISTYVYVLAIVLLLTMLTFRRWARLGPVATVTLWVGAYLVANPLLVQRPLVGGANTYLTISEVALLGGLALLARRLSQGVAEFEDAVCTLTLGGMDANVRSIEAASDEVCRVLLLSRRSERPLSVLVIEPAADSRSALPHRAVEQMHRGMLARFMVNTMANVVSDTIRRTDIPMQKAEDGRLVVVCPETNEETARTVIDHIQAALVKRLGFNANFGLATFPDEALTFENLVALAETQIGQGHGLTAVQSASGDATGKRRVESQPAERAS